MTGRSLVVVPASLDLPAPEDGTAVIVLDPAWTPKADDRPDVHPVRTLMSPVIEGRDLFVEALTRLDAWAEGAALADRLLVEGVTYWFRMREPMWHWLHERLLWRHAIRAAFDDDVTAASLPAGQDALADVLVSLSATLRVDGVLVSAEPKTPSNVERLRVMIGRARGAAGGTAMPTEVAERHRRADALGRRVDEIAASAQPRIIVLTTPATDQWIRGRKDGGRRDPNLGSIIPKLRDDGFEPVVIGLGLDHRSDDDWHAIESDPSLLPQTLLRLRWSAEEDDARVTSALAQIDPALDHARTVPLNVEGVDLSGPLVDALRAALVRTVTADVHQMARLERLFAEIRPRGLILSREGIRTSWVAAGARAGLFVGAVQHGVLYRTHPGYPGRHHPALVLPTRTFVFGDFERRALVAGAFRPDQVEVSGSPRLDLDSEAWGHGRNVAERDAVRRELGVADGDRLLVVSTLHLPFVRDSHLVHMLAVTLGGPLPGVHVVFKQHPGEREDGPYRALLEGLAAAGGYPAPPITVVRDVDLFRLLRAADAHLGMHSTVLTDAVAAGTPNLIAIVEGSSDLLGYVAAGVARPVRNVGEVRDALADPWPLDAPKRGAFLDDHFLPGDASARIVEAVRAAVDPR